MGAETVTRLVPDTEYDPRTQKVGLCVLHHGATTSLSLIESLMDPGGRTLSAHYAVKDGVRVRKVPQSQRAFSLSSAFWDSKAVTCECANESTTGWTISPESHESLVEIVVDAAREFGFWPHRDGDPKTWTVLGHREVYTIHGASYATACPGGMNLDKIASDAQKRLSNPESESDMRLIRVPDGTVFLVTASGVKPITSGAHLALLQRVLKSAPGDYVNLTAAEGSIVRSYFGQPSPQAPVAVEPAAAAPPQSFVITGTLTPKE